MRAVANLKVRSLRNFGFYVERVSFLTVAGPEMVGLDPQMREHTHVEIPQGRRVLQVLAVLEAVTCEEDGKIFRRVAAGVAGIAAGENGRAVEEVGVVFL